MSSYRLHKNAGSVDYVKWKEEKGILVPVFDIDGTLTSHNNPKIESAVIESFMNREQKFSGLYPEVAIATNNPNIEHINQVAKSLGAILDVGVFAVSIAQGLNRKPNPDMGLAIARHFKIKPEQLGVVGDRRISDITFARRLGAGAMALCAKIGEGDALFVPFVRLLENRLIAVESRLGTAQDYLCPEEAA